jgi:hypothetical protein
MDDNETRATPITSSNRIKSTIFVNKNPRTNCARAVRNTAHQPERPMVDRDQDPLTSVSIISRLFVPRDANNFAQRTGCFKE